MNPIVPPPPNIEDYRIGTKLNAGLSHSTVIADIDFETYSEAGYVWNEDRQQFQALKNAREKGLFAIGTARYAEHHSTEILSLAYNLKDGLGKRLWIPGNSLPEDLFMHVRRGGLLEAWNVAFERWIWLKVCVPKYNFPEISFYQWRDAMAKARAFSLPGALSAAGKVLNIKNKKFEEGKRLIDKFSKPRNPTKNNPKRRITPKDDLLDAKLLYEYNLQDIAAEAEISSLIPDLSDDELKFWQCDQAINFRGVHIDVPMINKCIKIIDQAHIRYNAELRKITNGAVEYASEVQKIKEWLQTKDINVVSIDMENLAILLAQNDLPPQVRRVLEIRDMIGSAAVKKLYAMLNQVTKNDRLHDLFVYHSAHTGRAAGAGPQPQNLPRGGPLTAKCTSCNQWSSSSDLCPWCLCEISKFEEWNYEAVDNALETISTEKLDCVEHVWGNAIHAVSGCVRSLFIAKPGHDLICSDYSAIEAVILAMLADETWRKEVFNTHGKIYEMSASKITGVPLDEILNHKKLTGKHHESRMLGKVAELASGYQGWIGAWKQFGADKFFNDDEIKKAILAWRAASPKIVEMWGGQIKDWYPNFYGIEGAAVQAVLNPGTYHEYNDISYFMHNDILYCRLLSGRHLTYHKPRLVPSQRRQDTLSLSYESWNRNIKYGSIGWMRLDTYGGKLVENIVQAVSRDILAHAIINLEKSGYPVVLHVHDEIVSEVPTNYGSVEEFERIMSTLPLWATGWPIKATGGWRRKRYSK